MNLIQRLADEIQNGPTLGDRDPKTLPYGERVDLMAWILVRHARDRHRNGEARPPAPPSTDPERRRKEDELLRSQMFRDAEERARAILAKEGIAVGEAA